MDKSERITYFKQLLKNLANYDDTTIENGVMAYCLNQIGVDEHSFGFTGSLGVETVLKANNFPFDLEIIIEFFEMMLDKNTVDENGIVFTPKYIADYIVKSTFENLEEWDDSISIIDPGCGCGIFLVAAAEYVHTKFNVPMKTILEKNIYGMDIEPDNARRCKLVLQLLNAKYHNELANINNIHFCDSLKENWKKRLNITSCDYVIGNPPYVNPHDLNKETVVFLKKTFSTTKAGVFNIFYAFIEQSMKYISERGTLGFIIPNNFLTIKSASDLRSFLQKGKYIKSILDFADNMVFKPVRTYNCIILLDKQKRDNFHYCSLETCEDIPTALSEIHFSSMETDRLDENGWKLVDEKTHKNLMKIENQGRSIKAFIRTGIATLRDGVYIVDRDDKGFYKNLENKRFDIELDIVKPIFKIPELKLHEKLEDAKRHIIFPYYKKDGKFVLYSEEELQNNFPLTYQYLLASKKELDSRDKGKPNPAGWYAYGRTQGLNKYGKKLLFPTFAKKPKFIYVQNEYALFCNGYAVFEDEYIDLDIMCKILNSVIMEYYVSQTSYPIEGGYYCYQKKYIERFSIPFFTVEELTFLKKASQDEVNTFLVEKYQLEM